MQTAESHGADSGALDVGWRDISDCRFFFFTKDGGAGTGMKLAQHLSSKEKRCQGLDFLTRDVANSMAQDFNALQRKR